MGLLSTLFRSGRSARTTRAIPFRGRYDAASTNDSNRRHWQHADSLSADEAMSPLVRQRLRDRARYEFANNSYAKGIVLTLANDVVGTGPRLQALSEDSTANAAIEQAWSRWAAAVRLPEKLRLMRMARAHTGEAFAVLATDPDVDHEVKLDIVLVEADRISDPSGVLTSSVDGIDLDRFGRPRRYHMLREHPGSAAGIAAGHISVPAAEMLHYFTSDRPEQHRGVPDLTPALGLFAQLRRFTQATLAAAETAANLAGVLHTDAPADGESDPVEPMDSVELASNAFLTLPAGWNINQVRAEHPSTGYAEFKREVLNEIARALNMPFNVAACNSASYNYASGRLDHQTYFRAVRIDQSHLASVVLDRILAAWFDEARLVPGLLPQNVLAERRPPHQWFWDGHEHVDPVKEASAQKTRLDSHTTTLAAEFAKQGKDWESELRQRARELELIAELGISTAAPAPEDAGEEADEDSDQDEPDSDDETPSDREEEADAA